MKKTKFLAVLMTVVLLFSVCAAGSSMLLNGFLGTSNAEEVDNDFAGLMEGLEIDTSNLAGIMGDLEDFNPDEIPNMIFSGILGSVVTTEPVNDDQMSTITTIVQALLGGTQEGETTLDAIKEKLGDLGGTVSENELIQAIVSTLLGFDLSNFDMSMLTSNEFITTLMGNLGGLNLGGAAQVTTTVSQTPTQSVVLTTAPTSVSTPAASTIVPITTAPSASVPMISTQPQQPSATAPYIGNNGTIVDNSTTVPVIPSVSVPTAPQATDSTQQGPDGTKSIVSPKMIVGIIVLLLSGISVVAVMMVMKKKG